MLVQKYLLPVLLLIFSVKTLSAQVNLNSGLVAYYPFNGNTNDASGNGNNAVNNGAVLTTDQQGNPNCAYYFDGISNFMEVANNATLNPVNNQLTLCARVYPTGFYNGLCYNNAIICKNSTDFVTGNYSLRFTGVTGNCNTPDTNNQVFRMDLSAGCGFPTINNTPYVQKNTWYCLVGVYDGTNIKMYVNGVLRYQCNAGITIGTNANDVFIGKLNSAQYPYWFKGKMDELRIYNRALNSQEIDSICNLVPQPASTIINKYAAVTARLQCDNTFSVDTATGFGTGDTVLMMQMKGATIDSSNTAAFGSVTALNGAGNYEYNIIKSVSGNNVTLKYKVQRQYDIPNGKVQFVRVPKYTNYTISNTHTCLPWTGTKGGVYVLNATGTVTLSGNIDVSGRGFKGGQINNGTTFACDLSNYYYDLSTNSGGMKGEGIAEISSAKIRGKGRLANGGGGGNSTNAGGGGGGNAGAGGIGGHQWSGGSCDSSLASGGLGGLNLSYTAAANRIFLGGGGGAGHENDHNTDPPGNGGGIIIVNAASIVGNTAIISANGTSCIDNLAIANTGDGQSGGGSGGTILIKAASFTGTTTIQAKGGNGGDIYAPSAKYGPGGGGGGGAVLFSGATLAGTFITTTPGANGVDFTYGGTNYDAMPGQGGAVVSGYVYGFPGVVDSFRQNTIIIAFSDSIASCLGRKFIDATTTKTTGIATYTWNFGSGNTSSQHDPTFTFPGNGTYPVKLVLVDSNGCKDSLTKNVIVTSPRFIRAGNDTTTCLGVPVTLHASGAMSYAWQPDSTLSGNLNSGNVLANPTAVLTSYIVEGTSADGCFDRDTVMITLVPGMPVVANPHQLGNCFGKTVQLSASGVSTYLWSPATNLSANNIANPVATVTGNMQYIITGKDAKGCISFDTVDVLETPGPQVHAYADGDGVSCYARAIQLHGTGALSYQWHPGAYLNDSLIAAPTAIPPRTTTFTVIGKDAQGCAGTDTITVASYASAVVFLPNAFTPNGDHINDDIRPVIFCDFKLDKWEVFNRWGQSVYQGYGLTKGWDGSFNGQPAPLGVYMYYVRGKNDDGQPVLYKGNITLLR